MIWLLNHIGSSHTALTVNFCLFLIKFLLLAGVFSGYSKGKITLKKTILIFFIEIFSIASNLYVAAFFSKDLLRQKGIANLGQLTNLEGSLLKLIFIGKYFGLTLLISNILKPLKKNHTFSKQLLVKLLALIPAALFIATYLLHKKFPPLFDILGLLLLTLVGNIASKIVLVKKTKGIPFFVKTQVKCIARNAIAYFICRDLIAVLFIDHFYHYFPLKIVYNFFGILTVVVYLIILKSVLRELSQQTYTLTQSDNPKKFDIPHILNKLGKARSQTELKEVTKALFEKNFSITPGSVKLESVTTKKQKTEAPSNDENPVVKLINRVYYENFDHRESLKNYIVKQKMELSLFYNEDKNYREIFNFLTEAGLELFIPVYDQTGIIIAYIAIEDRKKSEECYSDDELDSMVEFSTILGIFLSNINQPSPAEISAEKENVEIKIKNEDEKANVIRKSLHQIAADEEKNRIGIMFYLSNKKFSYLNETMAQFFGNELIESADYNVAKKIRLLVKNSKKYGQTQKTILETESGKKLLVTATPIINKNSVAITAERLSKTEQIKSQLPLLKNETDWPYLLYLKTTEQGKILEKEIPGHQKFLTNLKVIILKACLELQPILLNTNDQNTSLLVEVIRKTSLKQKIEVLDPQTEPIAASSFLTRLNKTEILHIKNFESLPHEIETQLINLIKTKAFFDFDTKKKVPFNVQIIFSTNKNLKRLIKTKKISKNLFDVARQNFFNFPKINSLPEEILNEMIESCISKIVKNASLKHKLKFDEEELDGILRNIPENIKDLRKNIYKLLKTKAAKLGETEDYIKFPIELCNETELLEYARKLGKEALKDQDLMTLLWKKFKNQAKIASELGVNKASVHRRCKEYKLS